MAAAVAAHGLLAVVVLLVLAVGAFLYLGGYLQRAADEVDVNVNVEAPNVELPDIKIETPKSRARRGSGANSELNRAAR